MLNKRKPKKSTVKNKKSNIRALVIIGSIGCLTVAFIWLMNSTYWPWPSQSEISRRLDEVIDYCIDGKNTRDCRTTQERYRIDFRYCHSLADIPEIDKPIPSYGVAVLDNFAPSDLYDKEETRIFPFYNCGDDLSNHDKVHDENQITHESNGTMKATSTLCSLVNNKAHAYVEQGQLHIDSNSLYRAIPNWESAIENKLATGVVGRKVDDATVLDLIAAANLSIANYASDKTVFTFYSHINTILDCEPMNKSTDDIDEYGQSIGYVVSYFTSRMHRAMDNDDFSYRPVNQQNWKE